MARRGRPAKVHRKGDEYTVGVNGVNYTFKMEGSTPRPSGETRVFLRNEDFQYARNRILEAIGNLEV